MVVEVLVAKRDPEYPLAQQRLDFMLDQLRTAHIAKAPRKAPDQPDRPIGCPKQQRPRIRCDRPAVKTGHNFPPLNRCKFKQFRVTLCRHRGHLLGTSENRSRKTIF